MNRRIVSPFAIIAVGILIATLFIATRSKVDRLDVESVAPLVRVVVVETETLRFTVTAHGTVEPPIQSELHSQVDGEIVWVSPRLAPGSFFEADEPLVRIDALDYEQELEAARAARDRAASSLSRATRENERQQRLFSQSASSVSRADEARDEYQSAEAALREARVRVAQAERDLERTELDAPYAGRTREKNVDIGQFVRRGDELASLYAIAYAEVPLPVPDRELAFLDLPLPFKNTSQVEPITGPNVKLRANFAGLDRVWNGHIVRTAAEIDARSRTVTVVARFEDPYGRLQIGPTVPLPVGLFVTAEIEGRQIDDAIVLPTAALRNNGEIYVIDDDGRLHFRSVEVLRNQRDEVVIGGGLRAGEHVVITPLRGAVDGMRVRIDAGHAELAGHQP